MTMPSLGVVLFQLAIALSVITLLKHFVASRRPRNFPPGPPTVPFLGNLTQVPRVKAFLKYVAGGRDHCYDE